LQRGTLFLSSVVGVPPFYVVTAICGTLRMPLHEFLILGTTGRIIRFAALMLLPQLFISQSIVPSPTPRVAVATIGGAP
jgi:membrane protein YqaA with SNARE-associated domain